MNNYRSELGIMACIEKDMMTEDALDGWSDLLHNFTDKKELDMWVYIMSEPGLWTVGFYAPDGSWHTDSDWNAREDARERVHYLNGSKDK